MREWIDTHLHLLAPQQLHYDWVDSLPALQGGHSFAQYAQAAQGLNISAALHMEVDVRPEEIEAESALIEALRQAQLGQRPFIAGFISACRPELPGFEAFLERQQALPALRGFRRVLHTQPDELSQQALFRNNLRLLARYDYSFDVCVQARQLPMALALARACPELRLILNHCGNPTITQPEQATWRQHIQELAALPQVCCKISGIIVNGEASRWPAAGVGAITQDLRPFVEHCIECFGWQRVLWGGDWPVCNLSRNLADWMAVTQALLSGCPSEGIDALAHGNARRIYRLGALA